MKRRRIAVVTTSRSDYGLLYWTLRAIKADPSLSLSLIACGSHLEARLGSTIREIERDGFLLAARLPCAPKGDDAFSVARALGEAASGFASALTRLKPDLLLVLGDRWELLAACSAAVTAGIPIAHIHGGESTEGAIDEQIRHAVTKMSHLHFPAAEPYRRRILQMGENPKRVFLAGAPGLENLRRLPVWPRQKLEKLVGLGLDRAFAVATCYPETSGGRNLRAAEAMLSALDAMSLPAIITLTGGEAGCAAINGRLTAWARARRGRAKAVASLGREAYLNLTRLSAAVIGNSSSGIIEAPSLRVPTVNIGDRQKGRLRAPSVIDCPAAPAAAQAALRKALSPSFRRRCNGSNPYGRGDSARKIVSAIKAALRDPRLPFKAFHDLSGASR